MKKIFLFISIVFLFIAAGLFYINKMLLPVHVKGFLLKIANEQLKGRDISIGDLHFDLFKGLTIDRVVITAKHNPTRAFFQTDKLNIKILLPPLLQKKIIIPSIQLYSPNIKLIRMDDALWNFSDLIPEKKEDEKKPFDVIIGGIKIFNGKVSVEDLTSKEPFSEMLTSINLQASVHLTHPFHSTIGLKGNFYIASSKGNFLFDTQIGIKEAFFKGAFSITSFNLNRYLPLLPKTMQESFIPFDIKAFDIQKIDLQTLYAKDQLSITISGSLPSVDVSTLSSNSLDNITIKGNHFIFDKFSCTLTPAQQITVQGSVQTKNLFIHLAQQNYIKATDFSSTLQLSKEHDSLSFLGDANTTSLDAFLYPLHITGDVNLNKTTMSFNDNHFNFSGAINIKDLSFKNTDYEIYGNISSNQCAFKTAPAWASFNGNLQTNSLRVLTPLFHFSGNADLQKTSLVFQDDALQLSTIFNGSALSFQMPNIKITTPVLSTSLTIDKNLQRFNLAGELSAQTLSLLVNQHIKLFSKNLSIKNFSSQMNTSLLSTLTAKGSINALDLAFFFNEHLSINTSLDIPQFTITPQEQQITQLTTDNANFRNFLLTLNDQQKIYSDLVLNQLSCSFNNTDVFFQTNITSKQTTIDFSSWTLKTPVIIKNLKGSFKDKNLSINTTAQFPGIEFNIPESIFFYGISPHVFVNLSLNTDQPDKMLYEGTLLLEQGTAKNLPSINSLTHLNSSLSFKNNEILFQHASFKIFDTPLTLTGTLKNFQHPLASVQFNVPLIDLKIVDALFTDLVKNEGLSINGQASLEGTFSGLIADPMNAQITTKLNLKNAQLKSSKHQQEVHAINGLVLYNHPKLAVENLQLTWQKYPIILNGMLEDFSNPYSEGTIKTTDITAEYIIKKNNDMLTIKKLKASWLHSTIDLLGNISLTTPPIIDLTGTTKLSLKDLLTFLPDYHSTIDPLKLGGIVKINFQTKGNPQQWPMLQSQINIESPSISILGYMLDDIKLFTRQQQGNLSTFSLSAKAYEGKISTNGSLSLTKEKFPFESSVHIENLNIASIKNATPALSSQQLSGLLTAMGNLRGNLTEHQDMTGKIATSIKDGYLWGTNALAGIAKILASLVQSTKDLSIQEASATWELKNKQIITSDLILRGPTLLIKGQGWLDWNQNIEMSLSPEILTNTSTATPNEDGTITPGKQNLLDFINPSSGLLHIRLHGNLSQPQVEHNLTAPKIIKKTLQNTVGNLLKILGNNEQ